MASAPLPALLTEQELAEYLRVSIHTVRRERHLGRIGYLRIGRRIMYPLNFVTRYVEGRSVIPCLEDNSSTPARSETTGSRKDPTVRRGAEHGLTLEADRHAAHRLAQRTFQKLSSG